MYILKNDFSYFDEDIDEDEFNLYVDMIKDNEEDEENLEDDKHNNCKNICDDFDLYKALNGLLKNKNEQNLVSINYLKSSCEKGNPISSYILDILYENGNCVAKKFK